MKNSKLLFGVVLGVALGLFLCKSPVQAAVQVYEVATSTFSVNVVTVSNSVATQIDATPMGNRAVIEIQNIDATANLWCSNRSAGAVVDNAHLILPQTSWILSISDRGSVNNGTTTFAMTVYCISDGGGSTKAAITQAY